MTFYALSALINALFSLGAGVLVQILCKDKGLRRTYVLFCVSIFIWSLFYFLWQISPREDSALLYSRALMSGAIFIAIFYLHHLTILFGSTERHRPAIIGIYTISFLFLLSDLTPYFVRTVKPLAGFHYWPIAGPLFAPFLLLFAGTVIYGIILIVVRLRVAEGRRRTQLLYVLSGTILGWSGGFTNFPLWYGMSLRPVGNWTVSLYLLLTSYAILRHQLMDINVLIRKTLVYSTVVGSLTLIYLSIVALFAHLFEGFTGYQTVFSSAIAAGLITFCFQPLRKRIQGFVDRKFFRQYVDREEKLYELSREVITHTTPEAMGGALMHVINEALHPKSGALFLRSRDGTGFMRVAGLADAHLPSRMEEDNQLSVYFRDHPQPFVQDMASDVGKSHSTRMPDEREDAA